MEAGGFETLKRATQLCPRKSEKAFAYMRVRACAFVMQQNVYFFAVSITIVMLVYPANQAFVRPSEPNIL